MYDTVIFDIDGTLADTGEGIKKSVVYTLSKLKLKELEEAELKKFVAYSPLKKGFIHFCGVDDETANVCCNLYRKCYKETMFLSKPYKDITTLLNILKKKNYKLGVATYKNEENAKLLLKALKIDLYFDYVAGADYEKAQTKTDILNRCMKKLKSENAQTIFIGDSPSDALAGKEIGCGFIGVIFGFGFSCVTDIAIYSPILIAGSVKDLIEFFR